MLICLIVIRVDQKQNLGSKNGLEKAGNVSLSLLAPIHATTGGGIW